MSKGFLMRGQVGLARSSSSGLLISYEYWSSRGLTPRFYHPDDTELSRMGFTCLCISNDLQ